MGPGPYKSMEVVDKTGVLTSKMEGQSTKVLFHNIIKTD